MMTYNSSTEDEEKNVGEQSAKYSNDKGEY